MAKTTINDEDFKSIGQVTTEVRWTKIAISIAGSIFGTWMAVATITGTPEVPMREQIWTQFFTDLTIVIYFFSWIFGSLSDLHAQHDVTRSLERSSTETRLSSITFILLLGGLFYFLRQASDFENFIFIFAIMFVLDILGWIFYVKRILDPQFRKSKKIALQKQNPISALEVDVVRNFMIGRWRLWRWGYSLFGFFLIWIVLQADQPKLWGVINSKFTIFSPDSLIAFFILIFIVLYETWIWTFRIGRGACRKHIKQFGEQYTVKLLESNPNNCLNPTRPSISFEKQK